MYVQNVLIYLVFIQVATAIEEFKESTPLNRIRKQRISTEKYEI